MAYEFHIVRTDQSGEQIAIPLTEWKQAIATLQTLRLTTEDSKTTLPDGQTLSIPHRDGDTQILEENTNQWTHAFRWRKEGQAIFRLKNGPGDGADPLWPAAVHLAKKLHCDIRGDEWESYDLETGQMKDA